MIRFFHYSEMEKIFSFHDDINIDMKSHLFY